MNWIRDNLRLVEFALFASILSIIAAVTWSNYQQPTAPVGVPQAAIEAPAMRNVPKVYVPVPKGVEAYSKPKLPDGQVLIVASEIRSSPRPQIFDVKLDPTTGKITPTIQAAPYHWLEARSDKEVGISYGWRGTQPMWRLDASWTLLQVKGLDLSLQGTLDADGQTYLGGRVSYRW